MRHNAFAIVVILAVTTLAIRAAPTQLEIVDDRQKPATAESSPDVGRPFEPAKPCSATATPSTIRLALGNTATRLIIHGYDRGAWKDFPTVQQYVHRILDAQPEAGMLEHRVYWSEYRPVEISASVQFRSGQRRRAAFANGYAHIEDEFGCQWWGRYLGPGQTRWIVRSP